MKITEQLLEYMQDHVQEYVEALRGAVCLESPTDGSREDLDRCRAYMAELFKSDGFLVSEVRNYDPRFADHLLMEYGKDAGSVIESFREWEKRNRSILEGLHEGTAKASDLSETSL